MLKPLVRSIGFIAMLTAGVVAFATVDGANARSASNGNGGSRQPQILNTIHPIIYKPPSKSDRDHDHDRKKVDRDRDRCRKSGKCYVGVPVTKPVRGILQ
jgi:hypothetical protein